MGTPPPSHPPSPPPGHPDATDPEPEPSPSPMWGTRCSWCWSVCEWPGSDQQVAAMTPGYVAAYGVRYGGSYHGEQLYTYAYDLCHDCVCGDESVFTHDHWPGDWTLAHVAILIPAPAPRGPTPVVWCPACDGPHPPQEQHRQRGPIYCLATGQLHTGWTAPSDAIAID